MNELGNPEIKQDCVWNIYLALLGKFHAHRIIAVDEWDIFFDDDCYEKTQSDPKPETRHRTYRRSQSSGYRR